MKSWFKKEFREATVTLLRGTGITDSAASDGTERFLLQYNFKRLCAI